MQNCGIMDNLFFRYSRVTAASQATSPKDDLRKLTLTAFSGPFALWSLCLTVASMSFGFEKIVKVLRTISDCSLKML